MLVRIGDLRGVIWEILLTEVNIAKILPRSARGKGLVVAPSFMGERLVAIDDSREVKVNIKGEQIAVPAIMGTLTGEQSGDDWVINTLFAEDPATAVYLLGAALAKWGRVKPDIAVSPAARAVIRRYWESNKDNPDLVAQEEEDPDASLVRAFGGKSTKQAPEDFMSAVFLDPGNIPLSNMLSSGDKIVDRFVAGDERVNSENDLMGVLDFGAAVGFSRAYASDKKTGRDWSKERRAGKLGVPASA